MTVELIAILVGLYFIGIGLPSLFARPTTFANLVELIYGIVLVVLAYLHVLH